jgi:hypothetical protein
MRKKYQMRVGVSDSPVKFENTQEGDFFVLLDDMETSSSVWIGFSIYQKGPNDTAIDVSDGSVRNFAPADAVLKVQLGSIRLDSDHPY